MRENAIWSSCGTEDYWWYEASDEEIKDYAIDIMGMDAEEIDEEYDIDDLRQKVVEYECWDIDSNPDYEDLINNIIPAIEEQCPEGYLWLVGGYQTWRGNHMATGFFDDIEKGIKKICYPNYDSNSWFYYDDDGNLTWSESHHDAPMGGTAMVLYRLNGPKAVSRLEDDFSEDDDEDGWGSDDWRDYADSPKKVAEWIEQGVLVPIKSLNL